MRPSTRVPAHGGKTWTGLGWPAMSPHSSLLHRCGIKSLAHVVALLAAVAVVAALLPAADASALPPHAEEPTAASSPATPDDTSARPQALAQATDAQPTSIPTPTPNAVTAGGSHTCGLKTDATITCWGNNEHGQTDAPSGTFNAVTAGWDHTCGLKTDATITCWGNNEHGQADAPSGTFNAVTASLLHTCGLKTDATITCWGSNVGGQADAPSGTFNAVTAGLNHTCGLKTDATITCWGLNLHGSIDYGQTDAPSGTFNAVTADGHHTCGLKTDATITCWGWNEAGQTDAPSGTFNAVTAGGAHTCGLKTDNTIACWGYDWGQIDAPGGTFNAVTAGGSHTCGLKTDATIACWGNNHEGQAVAPGGTFGPAGGGGPTVTVTKGGPGPTELGPGLGVACGANTPTCRYLNIELRGFAAGTYTVSCFHDGWDTEAPLTWSNFSITVDNSGSASRSGPCFINFAKLTANGAYVTVSRTGTATVRSNWLEPDGSGDDTSAPSAPTDLRAAPVHRGVVAAWSAPSDAGSSPIREYEIQFSRPALHDHPVYGDQEAWTSKVYKTRLTFSVRSPFLAGLTYTLSVTAVNDDGRRSPSATTTVTFGMPSDPSAPRNLTATARSNGDVVVKWSAPSSTGGSPISRYEVRYSRPRLSDHPSHGDRAAWDSKIYRVGGRLHIKKTLLSGVAYKVEVRAVNRDGRKSQPSISTVNIPRVSPTQPTTPTQSSCPTGDKFTTKSNWRGVTRVIAARSFTTIDGQEVTEGDEGGEVKRYKIRRDDGTDVYVVGLSQYGCSWVFKNAKIHDRAKLEGNAILKDTAKIHDDDVVVRGNAILSGNTKVHDRVIIEGKAELHDALVKHDATIAGDAKVWGELRVIRGPTPCIAGPTRYTSARWDTTIATS